MERLTEYRAGQLASLPALGLPNLPAAVTKAIAAYEAAMSLPVPDQPGPHATRQAVAQRAAELVREPPARLPELAADVTQVAAAQQAAAQAGYRRSLTLAVKDAAAEQVCQVMTENAAQVYAAIQARHKTVITDLASRAARLPPGIDTEGALTAGGTIREDLLHCRDRITELRALRAAMAQAEEPGAAEFGRNDGLAMCIQWERSGELYRRHWLGREGTTTAGPLNSEQFWLAYAALPELHWWLPTMAQADARTAELEAGWHAERVRSSMAG